MSSVAKVRRFEFALDDGLREVLQQLAQEDDRSLASQIRILIRQAGAKKGFVVKKVL